MNKNLSFKLFLLLAVILITLKTGIYVEAVNDNIGYANHLSEIGVFKGTDQGYELDRAPSRIEAAIMFVRMLGMENKIFNSVNSHPFADVTWGNEYIGYLYKHNLTKGINNNSFGSSDSIDSKSYITFMLRALGYSDSIGHFSWDNSLEFAKDIGLLTQLDYEDLKYGEFTRGDVAKITYNTLKTKKYDSEIKLVDILIQDNNIDKDLAMYIKLIDDAELNNEVFFEDKNLENSIKEVVGNGLRKITKRDLLEITSLNANYKDIVSIAGIEDLKRLETLYLVGNQINNISKLSNLTKLNKLNLAVNKITDITPLEGMVNLENLHLTFNYVKDLTPIGNLKRLKTLEIHFNEVGDISPISKLTNLEYLQADNNYIQDLTPLKNLERLEILSLDDNQINDINVLSKHKRLKKLYLAGNPIDSFISTKSYYNKLEDKDFFIANAELYKTVDFSNIKPLKSKVIINDIEYRETVPLINIVYENNSIIYAPIKELAKYIKIDIEIVGNSLRLYSGKNYNNGLGISNSYKDESKFEVYENLIYINDGLYVRELPFMNVKDSVQDIYAPLQVLSEILGFKIIEDKANTTLKIISNNKRSLKESYKILNPDINPSLYTGLESYYGQVNDDLSSEGYSALDIKSKEYLSKDMLSDPASMFTISSARPEELGSFVGYLIKNYSADKIEKVITGLPYYSNNQKKLDSFFTVIFGKDTIELYNEWRIYLGGKPIKTTRDSYFRCSSIEINMKVEGFDPDIIQKRNYGLRTELYHVDDPYGKPGAAGYLSLHRLPGTQIIDVFREGEFYLFVFIDMDDDFHLDEGEPRTDRIRVNLDSDKPVKDLDVIFKLK